MILAAIAAIGWGGSDRDEPRPREWMLDGCCPVTLVNHEQWRRGDMRFPVSYQGCWYCFVGENERKAFVTNPAQYSPVLTGHDVVEYADHSAMIVGRRQHGLFYHGKVYLFGSEQTLEKFCTQPQLYEALANPAAR